MKLAKPWFVVLPGAIHPVWLAEGDDCPAEMVEEARDAGILADAKVKAHRRAPETK